MNTVTINKWWDSLTHEHKQTLIKEMNTFNWGTPIAVHSITKNQKSELYKQVHDSEYLESLKKRMNDRFFGW
jgi:hypothetical protein